LRRSGPDFSTLPPTLFSTFAEYQNASVRDTQAGVDDIGVALCALFPFNDAKMRENLWMYSGHATLVISRIICMRPSVLNLCIGWDDESNSTFVKGNLSLGSIHPSGIYHDIMRDLRKKAKFDTLIPFRCYLMVLHSVDWPTSLCAVGSTTENPPPSGRIGLQVDSQFNGDGQPRT
jgi:hypothetical protein